MLSAVDYIHSKRIIHGDIKPANFVFVRNNLKLIDFGISKVFDDDSEHIVRESQIGTINYMAPETIVITAEMRAILIGKPSDVWSLGCILYQMLYFHTPFGKMKTAEKLLAIPDPSIRIDYPSHHDMDATDTVKSCLIKDPTKR
ncbi:unnamed protein product, partial [Sphagnum jensenii]